MSVLSSFQGTRVNEKEIGKEGEGDRHEVALLSLQGFLMFKHEVLTGDTAAKEDSNTMQDSSEEPGNVCDKNSSITGKYYRGKKSC